MAPKAIETRYKGYLFRSRLEARWAVFFDAVGAAYEYETEGFELAGGGRYLPDFRLAVHVGLVVRDAAYAERVEELSLPALENSTAWDDGYSIATDDAAHASYFEVKPPDTDLPDGDLKKIIAFAKGGSPILTAFGDPYRMSLKFLVHVYGTAGDGLEGYSLGEAAVVGAKNGVLMILVAGAGCEPDHFYRIAGEFRPNIIEAATKARSARFEFGQTPH